MIASLASNLDISLLALIIRIPIPRRRSFETVKTRERIERRIKGVVK